MKGPVPRRGFTWWIVVLLVVGGLLLLGVPIELLKVHHLLTNGHTVINCGRLVAPHDPKGEVTATGETCPGLHAQARGRAITGFVVSAGLIFLGLILARTRVSPRPGSLRLG